MPDMQIHQIPSPNHGPRRGYDRPDMVVIHFTGMENADAACHRLCDPVPEVSAHYLIACDGRISQLVPEDARAWHAGQSFWQGVTDINSASIGIELDYPGALRNFPPYPASQVHALERLLRNILDRHAISPDRVLGHSDVAPARKPDPGAKFDWQRLARLGLAETTPKPATGPDDFKTALERIGYDPAVDATDAFRLRWRPQAIGASVTQEDIDLANALARRRLT